MDKATVFETVDEGSIPSRGTKQTMKKEKIIKIIVTLVIIIIGGLSIYYAFKESPLSNVPSISLPPMPSIDLGIDNYENKNLGIKFFHPNQLIRIQKFSYPNDTLQLSETENSANLKSKYFVDADMSGIPGNEKIHYFGFDFEIKKSSIFEAIKQEVPFVLETTFPDNRLENFQSSEGFAEKSIIAQKESYSFLMGIEGAYTQYLFIPKNENETLLVKFMYIGEFLNPEISEADQKSIFEFIINTLKFI